MIRVKPIFALSGFAGCDGVVNLLKNPKADPVLVGLYFGAPLVARLFPIHAGNTSFAVYPAFSVLRVFKSRNAPQIDKPVVRTVAVNVVDFGFWALSMHNFPRNPVSKVMHALKHAGSVSQLSIGIKCLRPCGVPVPFHMRGLRFEMIPGALLPCQNASLWIVIQNLAQMFSIGQRFVIHSEPPYQVPWAERRETAATVPTLDNSPKSYDFTSTEGLT